MYYTSAFWHIRHNRNSDADRCSSGNGMFQKRISCSLLTPGFGSWHLCPVCMLKSLRSLAVNYCDAVLVFCTNQRLHFWVDSDVETLSLKLNLSFLESIWQDKHEPCFNQGILLSPKLSRWSPWFAGNCKKPENQVGATTDKLHTWGFYAHFDVMSSISSRLNSIRNIILL